MSSESAAMAEIDQLIDPSEFPDMSRRDRKKQETRWRIYNAGIALFAKYGYDNVKIEQICEEADVSSALFFHHFSSKSSLVYAFLEQIKSRIGSLLTDHASAESGEKLEVMNEEVARSTTETSGFTAQLISALTFGELKLDMEHLDVGVTGAISQIIRDGQSSGEFSKEWNPEIIAILFMSAWLIMPLAAGSPDCPEDPHKRLLDFVLHGLRTESIQ